MSKLSRREFLKATAALTTSGALAWRGDKINNSPVVGVDVAREERGGTEYAVVTDIDDDGTHHTQLFTTVTGKWSEMILQEQPFAPYCMDPPYDPKLDWDFPRLKINGREV